ncbi:RpiB/LacA/LacB family sugar-phosphate isomerase [Mariniflexile maritimum]|jgi:ribose 5-phosphate isomerase B|uniref:RpiB/LacA/LacB family sugar-phosphate isomerase n=1 Tax=Mariniflexile maritimum TaxID=2682493 RepID=UPI0012F694B5|nr:RpiB/LacA/LacB family sugar-phosphate isomerase [Mariniflexile maritimum]
MKISIGNDHAGTDYKFAILKHLEAKGHTVINHGTNTNESVDYADFVHPVAEDVASKKSNFGILLCGSANGVAITANKHQKIRAGLAWNKEIVHLIRSHNNANILCIPARFTALQQVIEMVDAFLDTPFEGGRHQTRIDKIPVSC